MNQFTPTPQTLLPIDTIMEKEDLVLKCNELIKVNQLLQTSIILNARYFTTMCDSSGNKIENPVSGITMMTFDCSGNISSFLFTDNSGHFIPYTGNDNVIFSDISNTFFRLNTTFPNFFYPYRLSEIC